MQHARSAVGRALLDDEIAKPITGALQLGPDPGHLGLEMFRAKLRQVARRGPGEGLRLLRVHAVVGRLDILGVRAETHLPGEIEGQMDPEPRPGWNRIDQSLGQCAERWRNGKVLPLARVQAPAQGVDVQAREFCHPIARQARRVDHQARIQNERTVVRPPGLDSPAVATRSERGHLGVEDDLPLPGFERSLIAPDQLMGIDNPRFWGQQCGFRPDPRLSCPNLVRIQPFDGAGPVLLRSLHETLEHPAFVRGGGHDELAQLPIRNALLCAPLVEERAPSSARRGLHRARRVVEPGVHDLTVAR